MHYVSSDSSQRLNDFAEVICHAYDREKPKSIFQLSSNYFEVSSHADPDYKGELHLHLKDKTYHICPYVEGTEYPRKALTSDEILTLFSTFTQQATTYDKKVKEALSLLESGCKINRRIQNIGELLKGKREINNQNPLPKGPEIFDNQYGNYKVTWISPAQFIKMNLLFFKLVIDEASISQIQQSMLTEKSAGVLEKKTFAPLILKIKPLCCGGYKVSDSDGIHRAEVARRLQISPIPVAVFILSE